MKFQKKIPSKKSETIHILCIGDIMGRPARAAVAELLPRIKKEYSIDYVIANAENLAHGKGVTRATLDEVLAAGVDLCTSGNHIWAKKEIETLFADPTIPVLRPANYLDVPGSGERVVDVKGFRILIINLMGRVFMPHALIACPFRTLDALLARYSHENLSGIIVDFHAEATAEKNTFGLYADGRVSAVLGTHTHVQTADERILPKGTAYLSDIGMVGILNSSIGISYESVIDGYLTQRPSHHEIPESGLVTFNACLIEIDPATKKSISILRINEKLAV